MKAVYWIPAAALAGAVVGSWGAREELRAYKGLGVKPEARASAQAGRKKVDGFDAFARMVQIPDAASRRRPPARQAPRPEISVTNRASAARQATSSAAGGEGTDEAERPGRRWRRTQDLGARIAEAQELGGARVDLARAQWKSKLKLEGESSSAFDSVLQEMNERLYDCVSTLAEIVGREEKLSPETGLRLVGETSSIMADAYDRIGACVAPEMRGEVAEINMVDFIDPGVAEPLVGVQDKLEMSVQRQEGRAR